MTNLKALLWKDIPDYEGFYQVNNIGEVRSVERMVKNRYGQRKVPSKVLKPGVDTYGYYMVYLSKNGVARTRGVGRLVALAFIPNPNNYSHCHHKDFNVKNNRVENLEWLTHKENMLKSYRAFKVSDIGEGSPFSKLTNKDVVRIKSLSKQGMKNRHISWQFDVTEQNIGIIVNGKGWRHI